jgi:RNA ligase (TIGR02306 family)
MSQFSVPVVRLGKIGKHPNADSLSLTTVEGGPCIFRTGDFREGDFAVYVPVDAIVPTSVLGTEFLKDKRRIRAVRLRGVFSMGLLIPTTVLPGQPATGVGVSGYAPGEDVAGLLGITKYEEPEHLTTQDDLAPAPKVTYGPPVYDVESWRKFGPFEGDPEVIVTEKIHGTNSRAMSLIEMDEELKFRYQLHVGSHRTWKKPSDTNLWWKMAQQYDLVNKLSPPYDGLCFYFETYGSNVQDLPYGHAPGKRSIAVFDIFDTKTNNWLDWNRVRRICSQLELPTVPVLYHGPLSGVINDLQELAKGPSVVAPSQIKEGVVIQTSKPGYDNRYGRTILKLIGEDYLLRKNPKEGH